MNGMNGIDWLAFSLSLLVGYGWGPALYRGPIPFKQTKVSFHFMLLARHLSQP